MTPDQRQAREAKTKRTLLRSALEASAFVCQATELLEESEAHAYAATLVQVLATSFVERGYGRVTILDDAPPTAPATEA